jgi:hypothetical protein
MATYNPPPYFPQSSLSPPDKNRYRKFKVIVASALIGGLVILAGVVTGIVYLIKWFAR